jgi:hypothetical protein
LEQNDPMLTLDQLIAATTALPDDAKTILIDKIEESMTGQIDSASQTLCERDILLEGVKKAQARIAEIDRGEVQPVTLTGLRGIAKSPGAAPNDDDLQAEYTDYLAKKYQ